MTEIAVMEPVAITSSSKGHLAAPLEQHALAVPIDADDFGHEHFGVGLWLRSTARIGAAMSAGDSPAVATWYSSG